MLLRVKSTQIKEIYLGKPPLISKKKNLIQLHWSTFLYTRLHSSILVSNCLDLSSDLSTLLYINLVSSSDLSTLVSIRLHLSSDPSTLIYIRLHSSRLVQTRLVTLLSFKNRLNILVSKRYCFLISVELCKYIGLTRFLYKIYLNR